MESLRVSDDWQGVGEQIVVLLSPLRGSAPQGQSKKTIWNVLVPEGGECADFFICRQVERKVLHFGKNALCM